jgi:histidinol phosphatase-like PHP family hydrolase
MWPDEAASLYEQDRSLTELASIGPHLERLIRGWLENPPPVPDPPDIRSGFFTIPEARRILARSPTWTGALKGDLQTHSVWSDGTGTIAEMAEAAAIRGYEFLAITDHAQGLKIAGGIDTRQLRRQAAEIEQTNEDLARAGHALRLLRSIELNLNPLGEGDMPRRTLAQLDIVLGCFHSALRKKEDQTERYVRALRNPDIQILGHPRGRIYNFRLGLNADWTRVFAVAAELDKAVEIDSYPDRQDLNVDLVRLAVREGCRISLGTDAHGPSQLEFIELGLGAALAAKVNPERVLNFMPRQALLDWVTEIRNRDD